jgi:hypothetical protein
MANTYKNNVSTVTSTGSDVAIYTCPSNATAIVNTIFVYNGTGGSADFTITLHDTSAGTSAKIYFKSGLSTLATDTVLGSGNVVVLEDSDILKINTTAQPLDVTVSVLQITRA